MIELRRLREDDLEYLHRWENQPEVWTYGDCGGPVSRGEVEEFIRTQQTDNNQVRLIVLENDRPVGFIDFFNIEGAGAGVGILICDPADRGRGLGREALTLAIDYALKNLGLSDLWCQIHPENIPSLRLFSSSQLRILK